MLFIHLNSSFVYCCGPNGNEQNESIKIIPPCPNNSESLIRVLDMSLLFCCWCWLLSVTEYVIYSGYKVLERSFFLALRKEFLTVDCTCG